VRKEECYLLGKIIRKHGLLGDMVLKMDTDQPNLYTKMESMFIEIDGLLIPYFIGKISLYREDSLVFSIKNSNDALVNKIIGKYVYQPLSSLPKLSGKNFYYHEILEFEVKDTSNTSYGLICRVNDQTPQHYFVLALNEQEVIIPIVKEWILEIDRKDKVIKMQLPEGLLDIFIK